MTTTETIFMDGAHEPIHPTAMMLIPELLDQNPHSTYEGLSFGEMPLYMSANEIKQLFGQIITIPTPAPNIINIGRCIAFDGSTVERKTWLNGDNCSSIQELKVIGGDHDWPGSFGNMDINATNEIWNFVSQYDINGLIDCNTTNIYKINMNHTYNLIQITDLLEDKRKN